ncbi:MAG: DAK2 domain-containing protein, partial [Clostridiales bacterium]|nr:DAK2 domain-containing protein [Clostridiales bacterium]
KIGFAQNAPTEPPKEAGFVTVAAGEGFREIFKNLGADFVIEGGQTMNPSAENILNAIKSVNAKNIFIFPNNKNIFLAAKQAASMAKDKNCIVMQSKSVPQGITALVSYNPNESWEENKKSMTESMEYVHCGQVTTAVRDATINDIVIKTGDALCLYDGDVVFAESSGDFEGAKKLIVHMAKSGGEVMTIYCGADATESAAAQLAAFAGKTFPQFEVEVQKGGQVVYPYIISVE